MEKILNLVMHTIVDWSLVINNSDLMIDTMNVSEYLYEDEYDECEYEDAIISKGSFLIKIYNSQLPISIEFNIIEHGDNAEIIKVDFDYFIHCGDNEDECNSRILDMEVIKDLHLLQIKLKELSKSLSSKKEK